jgi:hypothetical protein
MERAAGDGRPIFDARDIAVLQSNRWLRVIAAGAIIPALQPK